MNNAPQGIGQALTSQPGGIGKDTAVSHAALGMLIFVVCEIMFFGGLVSAYLVGSAGQDWPPAGQPRLPVWTTAFNTAVLLLSGWFMKRITNTHKAGTTKNLGIAMILGLFFVGFQGIEWTRLISHGLTMSSSTYGSYFYLIIGAHATHALAALCLLAFVFYRTRQGALNRGLFEASRIFWLFVVGLWPVLYILVYLV